MTDRFGPGQADKAAAEQRTAQVAAENKAQGAQSQPQAPQQPQSQAEQQEARQKEAEQGPKSAADKLAEVDFEPAVSEASAREVDPLVNPYPEYGDMPLGELRSLAESRNVEINRDVEKAHLVSLLRAQQPRNPAYDHMPLERLRSAAGEKDVKLDEEFEKAHLITELRAADTHTG